MKTFIQSIKIIAVALIIGWGVSAVHAWTAPTVNPPGTGTVKSPANDTAKGVAASINLTNFDQIKRGGLLISGADNSFVSPLSFFKKTLLPGSDTSVYIGGASYADPSFASSFPGTRSVPMTINLTGRADTTGAIKFKTDAQCPVSTKLINTNASAFEFWNTAENTNADILAKGIRLDGGNPAPGKILISVDSDGRAVWATPKLAANGTDIIFDTYSDSPVGICGTPVTPATSYNWVVVWSGCKVLDDSNLNGDYLEYPDTTVCRDSNGNRVFDTSLCPQPAPGPRIAANSLPVCTTPIDPNTGSTADQYSCHVIGSTGTWVKNRHMDYSVSPAVPKPKCTTTYIPPLPPSTGDIQYAFSEGDVICSTSQPVSTAGSSTWCTMPRAYDSNGDGVTDTTIKSLRNSGSSYQACSQSNTTCP